MKNTTLKISVSALAISSLLLPLMRTIPASVLLPAIAVTVSYVAVTILLALAAVDYRGGPKNYSLK